MIFMMNFNNLKENYTKVSYKHVEQPTFENVQVQSTFNKRKVAIKLIRLGVTVATIYFFGFDGSVFAASVDSLDVKAERFYFDKFIRIAKWAIIVKGGWDIVNKTLKEDFDGAKRSVLQYGMVFAVLIGLPGGLKMIEELFRG